MTLLNWEDLPESLRCPQVKPYYDALYKQKPALRGKRAFDVMLSAAGLVILSPLMLTLAVMVKADSPGPVFFRQPRVTQYGKVFNIHKFRTMADNSAGPLLTVNDDSRVTEFGRFLRKSHLDELGQLIDILSGNMTFVGTRPEVPEFVDLYTPEMRASLLLPAGMTSRTTMMFENEAGLLNPEHPEDDYVQKLLPKKMRMNLEDMLQLGMGHDLRILVRTVTHSGSKKDGEK